MIPRQFGFGRRVAASVALATLCGLSTGAMALEFPYNALRWVTASAAGGSSDQLVRALAGAMGESLGKSVIVENILGPGGQQAAANLLKAGPDGHTWLAADNGVLIFNPALHKSIAYDRAALAPVGLIARAPLLVVTSAQSGIKTAKDWLEQAKAEPRKFNYASIGSGSPSQLAIDLLAKRAGLQFVRVPFGSDLAAVNDVASGQVSFAVVDLPAALPLMRSGKLVALASFTARRVPGLPEVPSMAELGQPELNVYLWQGLAVHAKTPPDVQAKISKALQAASNQASLRKRLSDAGWEMLASDGGFLSAYLGAETATWQRTIKEAGLKVD